MKLRPLVSCGLLAVMALSPTPGSSQRLGVSYVLADSNHPELSGPRGLIAHADVSLEAGWDFRVSFHRVAEENDKEGLVCRHYAPSVSCSTEMTHTSLSLSGLRLGVLKPLFPRDRIELRVGGGGSFNILDGHSRGESGLRADLLIPNGGQIGAFAALLVGLTPFPSVPVFLEGGFKIHWVNFSLCSGEDPPQYDPFCTPDTFREIEFGVSFPLR